MGLVAELSDLRDHMRVELASPETVLVRVARTRRPSCGCMLNEYVALLCSTVRPFWASRCSVR